MATLLAKSIKLDSDEQDKEALTLVGHLELGIQAALALAPIAPIICEKLNLKISPEELIETVVLAIWLHDWGKANQDFQAMVQGVNGKNKAEIQQKQKEWFNIVEPVTSTRPKQLIRHELLSVVMMRDNQVWSWLSQRFNKSQLTRSLLAVLGHHLKVSDASYFELKDEKGKLQLYSRSPDFKAILKLGCQYLGLSEPLPSCVAQFKEDCLQKSCQSLGGDAINSLLMKFECNLQDSTDARDKLKAIAVTKALTMAADLAASALLARERKNRSYTQWIGEALSQVMTAAELQQVIEQKLGKNTLLDFQQQAAKSQSRVLAVVAGCGAGKSIVPFCFFKRLAEEEGIEGKVFFCYPTTATTSQGFEDYALPTPIENKLLMHSRAWVDEELKLKNILKSYDSDDETESVEENERLFQTKVEALKLWHSKLIYCTAHTVLGLMQNHRKGLYGFPGIICGVYIFDEIHAYPTKLFEMLLEFIRTFSTARIVLMSASLSPAKLAAIQEVLAETNETLEVISGPRQLEEIPRYQLCEIAAETDAWHEAEAELDRGGKVLWIVNSVADCQRIYTEARDRFQAFLSPAQTLIYHSRFRYNDALDRHKDLIAAFRKEEIKPAFAVTTQIAEMSLDISATLLISANAPMAALIQRLGRLNRWVKKTELGYKLETEIQGIKANGICRALIYPWEKSKPYEKAELEKGSEFVQALNNKTVNQIQLSEQLEEIEPIAPLTANTQSEWLQTWRARSGELIPPTYTTSVILEADVAEIFKPDKKPWLEAQKWAVSVRIQPGKTERWERNKAFAFYRIAPVEDVAYHPEIGAYEPQSRNQTFLVERYGHKTKRDKD